MNFGVYYGGCWSTNIGNAFIDYGSKFVCSSFLDHVFLLSEFFPYIFNTKTKNLYRIIRDIKPKVCFFSGMVLCDTFYNGEKNILDYCLSNKIPIIMNGVGGNKYNKSEIAATKLFFETYKPKAMISRDDHAFDLYEKYCQSYKGLDLAFFLPDIPDFSSFSALSKIYHVINDDTGNIGKFDKINQQLQIIHCHHVSYPPKLKECYINQPDTLISEIPDEYIYVYARSAHTLTTRVHACIVTLAFGGKAKLISETQRAKLFDVCCDESITSNYVQADMEKIKCRKQMHRLGLQEALGTIK